MRTASLPFFCACQQCLRRLPCRPRALAIGLAAIAGMVGCRSTPVSFTLTDVTLAAGIEFRHTTGGTGKRYFLETTGSGACWLDYDADGWVDLYLVQNGPLPDSPDYGPGGNRLYRNLGTGAFQDVTSMAGVAGRGYGQGSCAADIDNDGFVDIFVAGYGYCLLYRNNGDGTFVDITDGAGLGDADRWNSSAAFGDYDNDGFVDLYVGAYCRYTVGSDPPCPIFPGVPSYCGPLSFEGESGHLYRNNGDGTFSDVSVASGVRNDNGKNLGVVWSDVDNDGYLDLFIANDNVKNQLLHNQGDGTFRDVADEAGVAVSDLGRPMAGMGVDFADYDGDGWQDCFVANYADEPNALWRNRGGRYFEDVTFAADIGETSMPRLGFGAAFADLDLDGRPDILVANGHVQDQISMARPEMTYGQPNFFFRNLNGRRFAELSDELGPALKQSQVSRGLCTADYDNDGDVDVLICNLNAAPTLLRNDRAPGHHWLGIQCVGRSSNRSGVGAVVTVRAGRRTQVAEVRAGSSYMSQNDMRRVFGLARARRASRVEVRWPSGVHTRLTNVTADRYLRIVEGASP